MKLPTTKLQIVDIDPKKRILVTSDTEGKKSFAKKLEELKFAEATVDTVRGDVRVKWLRQYGKTVFNITIPFGSKAEFVFRDTVKELESGFYTLEFDGE